MHPKRHPTSPVLASLLLAAVIAPAGCTRFPKDDPESHSPDARIRSMLTASSDPVLALATGDTIHLGDEVRAFYEARQYQAAWTDDEGFLPRGQALVTALREADEEGLDLADYHGDEIPALLERAKGDVEQDLPVGDLLGNVDLMLTEAYLRYTTDVLRGTIDPGAEGLDWKVPREDATDAVLLNRLLDDEDFDAALAELRPQVPFYDGLRTALPRYRQVVANGGWPTVAEGGKLAPGVRDARVAQLRARLVAEGDPVEAPLAQATGPADLFDDRLAQAVKHFQDRHGLAEDGAPGGETLKALNVPAAERLQSIQLNLDRWRWLPRELGSHYIIVNVAGFEMAVMKDNAPALAMKVVVGKTGNETPIFRDTLEQIVVNPYWNVPPNIYREEVLPAIQRDPGYLARNNMEMVGKGASVGVRQRPGPKNALGEVKFLFPNDHDVYMHDTPADALFSRQSRAFSHGCIRLENPRELAYYLFQNAAGKTRADYDRLVGGGEKWVKLTEKLPVYIVYFTAWPDRDGSVAFYQDIYRRDAMVEKVAAAKFKLDAPTPDSALATQAMLIDAGTR
jgi:murein L,D-transpeptidase YcbB/YkuD